MAPSGNREHQDRRHSEGGGNGAVLPSSRRDAPSPPRAAQSQSTGKKVLSQWRMLSYVLWGLFRRSELNAGLPFLVVINMLGFMRLSLDSENVPNRSDQICLIILPLFLAGWYVRLSLPFRGYPGPRAYAALPIGWRALTYGVLMCGLAVFGVQAMLLYGLFVALESEHALPFAVFLACLVVVLSGMVGGRYLRAFVSQIRVLDRAWISAFVSLGWLAASISFMFRMAGKSVLNASDWKTMLVPPDVPSWMARSPETWNSPFAPANLPFLTLSALVLTICFVVLVLSFIRGEDIVGEFEHKRWLSRPRPSRAAPRPEPSKNIRLLVSVIETVFVAGAAMSLPVLFIWIGTLAAEVNEIVPVFALAFFFAYAIPFYDSLSKARPLRTLPLSSAFLGLRMLAKPALSTSVAILVAVPVTELMGVPVSIAYSLMQAAGGCLLAHLVCLTYVVSGTVWTSAAIALCGLGLLFVANSPFHAIAALPPFAAWSVAVAIAAVSAALCFALLERVIRNSTGAYRNLGNDRFLADESFR